MMEPRDSQLPATSGASLDGTMSRAENAGEQFETGFLPYLRQHVMSVSRDRLATTSPRHKDRQDRWRDIGQRCQSIRLAIGLSRQEVAQRAGIDQALLAAFENGFVSVADMPAKFPERLSRIYRAETGMPPKKTRPVIGDSHAIPEKIGWR